MSRVESEVSQAQNIRELIGNVDDNPQLESKLSRMIIDKWDEMVIPHEEAIIEEDIRSPKYIAADMVFERALFLKEQAFISMELGVAGNAALMDDFAEGMKFVSQSITHGALVSDLQDALGDETGVDTIRRSARMAFESNEDGSPKLELPDFISRSAFSSGVLSAAGAYFRHYPVVAEAINNPK